jgi:anti-anti-sigma factor
MVIKRLPEQLNQRSARSFWQEMRPILQSDRPQIVFDLSEVKRLDAAGVEMLLQCVVEVVKQDGDLKLAAVSPAAAVILEMTRSDRLFEIYESVSDARRSFSHYVPASARSLPVSAPVVAAESEDKPEQAA